MATGRLYGVTLEGAETAPITGHIIGVWLEGSEPSAGMGQLIEVWFEGEPAFIVAPFPTQQPVDPGVTVSLTGTVGAGPAADSWTFTQTDGVDVTLSGTGATRTFTAPGSFTGTTVKLSVTATAGEVESEPTVVEVPVLPQSTWVWDGENPSPMFITSI
jgi:hypothetical protein